MFDLVLVESISGKVGFRGKQAQLFTWHKPQQIAFAAAVGAVAFHYLAELTLNFI
jgi:hypothetical protein